LKVLLVNLLAALNFALPTFFKKIKNVWKIKNVKKRKNVTKIKKRKKRFFASMPGIAQLCTYRSHFRYTDEQFELDSFEL